MKLYISFLTLFSIIAFAKSGDRAGNGGDAILCYAQNVTVENVKGLKPISTQLKDYWEYSQMIQDAPLALGEGRTYQEKVLFVLERLKKIDRYRAEKLIKRFKGKRFFSLVGRGQILVVNDSNSYLRPSKLDNCVEAQVAFQILKPRMYQSKVLIDKEIFMNMSEEHKAGLLLHELLYEHDIMYAKATDSDTIRWFNYILSSDINILFDDLKNGYSEKYFQMITENKVDYFDYASQYKKSELYRNQKQSAESYKTDLLPEKFDIIDSHFVMDGEKTVKAKIDMSVEDSNIEIFGSLVSFLNKNIIYELKDSKEMLKGDFKVFSDGLEFDSSKVEVISSKLRFVINSKTDLFLGDIKVRCLNSCYVKKMQNKSPTVHGEFLYKGKQVIFFGKRNVFSLKRPLTVKFINHKEKSEVRVQRMYVKDSKVFSFVITPKLRRKSLKLYINKDNIFDLDLKKKRQHKLQLNFSSFKLESISKLN